MNRYKLEMDSLTVPESAVENLMERANRHRSTMPRRGMVLAACFAVLCALSVAAVARVSNGWFMALDTSDGPYVSARPELKGTEYSDRNKDIFADFVQEYGGHGELESLEELEDATGLDILQSNLLTLEELDGTVRVPAPVIYSVTGGDQYFDDYLVTAHLSALYFQPLDEGDAPTWWEELLLKNGQTESLGDLIPVRMTFSTKVGEDAPDTSFGMEDQNGDFTFSQHFIESLNVTAEIACDHSDYGVDAFFTVDDVAYWIKIHPNDVQSGMEILYDVLGSLK